MRPVKTLPSVEYLRACFRYDDGKLFWRVRPKKHFVGARTHAWWNTVYAETEAFTCISTHGYFYGRIKDSAYLAHRVIWKLVSGTEPPPILDHVDRDSKNNRYENLRPATKSQNNINSARKIGVCFDKSRSKWVSYVKVNGKHVHRERHTTKKQAVAARRATVLKYYGVFAP